MLAMKNDCGLSDCHGDRRATRRRRSLDLLAYYDRAVLMASAAASAVFSWFTLSIPFEGQDGRVYTRIFMFRCDTMAKQK